VPTRLHIRTKLASALAIPPLALVGLAWYAIVISLDAGGGDDSLRERIFLGVAGVAVLIALALTWLIGRSITRPLRSLRAQAEEMAEQRLPAAVRAILDTPPGEDVVIPPVIPIEVKTRDEVRDVAAALNAVQRRALDLAVEQVVLRRNISDSFVNLGRRNQNLLNRQLELITELESATTEPDELASLFRLDQLATRMRRNAESLLVLAGVEPPRQWSAPIDIADVVRSALGEVEDYQRVSVRHLEPATLIGSVATDIAHVLAELIENGLTFSSPAHEVEVKGRLTPAGYALAVTDNGVGMRADEIARANKRLAGEESFSVAPSRYLGHYVAGHLALRHGIGIELQDDPGGGTLARVLVPMCLVNDSTLAGGSMDQLAAFEPSRPTLERTNGDTVASAAELVPAAPEQDSTPPSVEWADDAAPVGGPAASTAGSARPRHERGFGGLAVSRDDDARAAIATTTSGLPRRVPGTQRPDAAVAPEPAALDTTDRGSTPDDVYSFLSSFASGVEQGRVDAHGASDAPGEGSS
jgi:signal transduction histidine kinase